MKIEMNIYEQLDPDKEDSFACDYKKQKELFDWKTIREEKKVPKLENTYKIFQELSDRVIILSKEYFKQVLDNDTEVGNKRHYDLSMVYITEIQNLYLNPINYRLNQLNNKKSLNFAIAVAIVSLILAIASIGFTYYFGKNPTSCSCCFPEKVEIPIIGE